jgi:RHS repeat-associated protein
MTRPPRVRLTTTLPSPGGRPVSHPRLRSRILRSVAALLVPLQVATLSPSIVLAAEGTAKRKEAPAAPPRVSTANRTLPRVQAPPAQPRFSSPPTDAEIFRARVFAEPLVPHGATSAAENVALAKALLAYLDRPSRDDLGPLEAFLRSRPGSAWRPSLLASLGVVARRTGHYSKALDLGKEAWNAAKGETDRHRRATADRAFAEVAELYARLGRVEELEALLGETVDRELSGTIHERIEEAKQGLWLMKNRPEIAFRCGPLAVESLLRVARPDAPVDPRIAATPSTRQGTSLAQMKALAMSVGMKMQIAHRDRGAALLLPALVHWKSGHFAAIVRTEAGRYLVQDPTFGDEVWMDARALDEEASGYFLVADSTLPGGWRVVADEEGADVWGKGAPGGQNSQYQSPCDPQSGGNGGNCSGPSCGGLMAVYSIHTMLASLRIVDTPVGYTPPFGPDAHFQVSYRQREAFQPQVFWYSNLGPNWTFDWLSYLEDDPLSTGQTLTLYLPGGGQETYTGYNAGTKSYAPHFRSRAVIVLASATPARYERHLPDGSVQVFAQADGSFSFPRRIFLTEMIDPQGASARYVYDDSLRLVAAADAIGQVTTLSYDLPSDPLKITRVTDPFGRFATFDYDPGGRLSRITDVIGLSSDFAYEGNGFISALTTPYGTTRFAAGQNGADRWIEATDPLGGVERVEFINGHTNVVPSVDPTEAVPAGFAGANHHLDTAISFYWDKRAMALAPGDYTKAEVTHWLWESGTRRASGIPRANKKALEGRVWYLYPGQSQALLVGSHAQPSVAGRLLDDGTPQIHKYEYNSRGKVTRYTDPRSRETIYEYDPANEIDLLHVKQRNGSRDDLLESRTYNDRHQPLTVTDTAGQILTLTYNPNGTLATLVTPSRDGLSLADRTTRYVYFEDDAPFGPARVQSIQAPLGASIHFTYDGEGRPRTLTDLDGYTVTLDYDAADRETRVTYPDGRYEETVYNRLDWTGKRDRLGRWTHQFHDALGRLLSYRDPVGRTMSLEWCSCGSLDRMTDGNGNATRWERDLQGRVTAEVRANSSQRLRSYEGSTGRLKSITDANGQTRNYTYFADDTIDGITYDGEAYETPNVSYTYDPAYARPATMTDGAGTTEFTYHRVESVPSLGAGQLASVGRLGQNDTITFGYDELGRRVRRTLGGITTTVAFDALHRPARVTHPPTGTYTYTYSGSSTRLESMGYPNGTNTRFSYLSAPSPRLLQQIHHTKGETTLAKFDYAYDEAGILKTWQQQDGPDAATATAYDVAFDAADQLVSAVHRTTDPNPSVRKRYGYAYDAAGNRTTARVDDAPVQSVYDNMHRLTSVVPGGALRFAGATDEAARVWVQATTATTTPDNHFSGDAQVGGGDITVDVTATDGSGNTRTNTYGLAVTGAVKTHQYDRNGNLTEMVDGGDRWRYEWYADDKLARVTKNGAEQARFVYDAIGRRYQKIAGGVTSTYVYDVEDVLRESRSDGPVYDNVHGPGYDEPLARRGDDGNAAFYHADHLGSVVKVTDGVGGVALTRRYDLFGNMDAGADVSGPAFTGRDWDKETGLYYYRARYYAPGPGRFISEDPIRSIEPAEINRYGYVAGNPIWFVDPTGLSRTSLPPIDPCFGSVPPKPPIKLCVPVWRFIIWPRAPFPWEMGPPPPDKCVVIGRNEFCVDFKMEMPCPPDRDLKLPHYPAYPVNVAPCTRVPVPTPTPKPPPPPGAAPETRCR